MVAEMTALEAVAPGGAVHDLPTGREASVSAPGAEMRPGPAAGEDGPLVPLARHR